MERISKKSLVLWRLRLLLLFILPIAMLGKYLFFEILLLIIFLFLFFAYLPAKHNRTRYVVSNGKLKIIRGVIFRCEVCVLLDKIQYISLTRTPLEGLLGLQTALIFSSGAVTMLGGLDKQTAKTLLEIIDNSDV